MGRGEGEMLFSTNYDQKNPVGTDPLTSTTSTEKIREQEMEKSSPHGRYVPTIVETGSSPFRSTNPHVRATAMGYVELPMRIVHQHFGSMGLDVKAERPLKELWPSRMATNT